MLKLEISTGNGVAIEINASPLVLAAEPFGGQIAPSEAYSIGKTGIPESEIWEYYKQTLQRVTPIASYSP
jgi:hypothetical protein